MTTTPTGHPTIDPADLVELGELCGFLRDWLRADPEPDPLRASLRRFTFGLFTLDEITTDLARFAWVLNPDEPHTHHDDEEDRR